MASWPLWAAAHGLHDAVIRDFPEHLDVGQAVSRLPAISEAFAGRMLGCLGDGAPRWSALWPVGLLAGLLALRARRTRRVAVATGLILLAHLGLYVGVFAITPRDLDWHLGTAASRLVLHTVPWLVLLMRGGLMAAVEPEQAD